MKKQWRFPWKTFLLVQGKAGKFLTNWATASTSRRILVCEVASVTQQHVCYVRRQEGCWHPWIMSFVCSAHLATFKDNFIIFAAFLSEIWVTSLIAQFNACWTQHSRARNVRIGNKEPATLMSVTPKTVTLQRNASFCLLLLFFACLVQLSHKKKNMWTRVTGDCCTTTIQHWRHLC